MLQPDVGSVLRLAKEAIIAWHLEGTIAQWNPSAERLYYRELQNLRDPLHFQTA